MCDVDKETIKTALEKLAYKKTIPFCYSCYEDAPSGTCKRCFSDDLMRHLPGYGVEFGTEWVINALLEENVAEPNFEELFESSIDDCYETEIQVGWLKLDPASIIKTMDPISWNIAKGEYIDSLEEDEQIVSFDNGSSYYWVYDIVEYLKQEDVRVEGGGVALAHPIFCTN